MQLFTKENKSGAKGRYVGVTFVRESDEIEIWIGRGITGKKQGEIYELVKEHKIKYSLIESNLKLGFEYTEDCYDARFIKKKINIKNFDEGEFEKDIEYITNLYKTYEVKFENAIISLSEEQREVTNKAISYEEINQRMLMLIEEVGNLANAIKGLKKQ